jgi:hypothetical protein
VQTGLQRLRWRLICEGSRLCVKLLPEGIIDKLVIHVNINKLTKHEFIPLEGGFGQYDKKWGDSYYGQGRK